jgi:Protein of unknown function (DUF5818)
MASLEGLWTNAVISDRLFGAERRDGAARSRLIVKGRANMVKRAMLAGFAMVFAVGLSVAGQDSAAKSGSWTGVVTNDMCGAKDASAAKAECTSKCVKSHGAKYALYDEAGKKVYILEPQDKADGHAGHEVTVKGTLDGDTIHVTSLTMNTAKGS